MLRNVTKLEGHELQGPDGTVGHVRDFFFDEHRWFVRYLVVDTGTWLNRREVLISPIALIPGDWTGKLLRITLSKEQVRRSPSVDTQQVVSRQQEAELSQYYNWPAYWGAPGFVEGGFGLPMVPQSLAQGVGAETGTDPAATLSSLKLEETRRVALQQPPRDSHLRSMRKVKGHRVEATDGSIGEVTDFIVDDATWEIHYLVIDTGHFWPGKKVLIAPRWINDVSWNDSKVYADLTREGVKASPAYDAASPLDPDYGARLHEHYGRPFTWLP